MVTPLTLATYNSPLGDIIILQSGKQIHICEFSDRQERVSRQIRQHYQGHHIAPGPMDATVTEAFDDYFSGNSSALNAIDAVPMGTDFERKVWQTLRNIPPGALRNYGSIAEELNSAARAVGRANGRNPVSLIVPCHRVIGADGSLTGYAGGLHRKEWLLKHEGALLNL
ncbi:MAG: methylated-DNA--[protein]-cysteine S-methyltransferase [Kordiimonas sp.]